MKDQPSTPAPVTPAVPTPLIARQKAQFTSQLLMAEHELAGLKADVADKEREIQRLIGAVSACDTVIKMAPPPEAPKKADLPDAKLPDAPATS